MRTKAIIWRNRNGYRAAAFVVMLAHVAGCSCEDDKKKEAPAVEQTPAAPAHVDGPFLEQLEQASKTCDKSEARGRITCDSTEKNAIILSFNKGERNRIKALPTLAYALQKDDEKLQAIAAAVLYASFRTGFGTTSVRSQVSQKIADDLLALALELPDSIAMQVIPAATHAAMLAAESPERRREQSKKLLAALTDKVPLQARTTAYRYLMTYGRLDVFPMIQDLGKDKSAAVVLSALESPRNMGDWTPREQDAICPWIAGFVEDQRAPVASNAMAALGNCKGPELDKLLDAIEKAIKKGQYSFIQATALRDICASDQNAPRKRGGTQDLSASEQTGPSEAQCGRVRSLQERATESPDVKGRVRATSLSSLAYMWPDEKTLALAKKLSEDKDPELKRTATQVATRLERRFENQKKVGAASSSPGSPRGPIPRNALAPSQVIPAP